VPPQAALNEAKTLLSEIGAIDEKGRITEEGRKLRALPLPPRLARMVVDAAAQGAGETAAAIAAVLTERGLGGNDVDLGHRLENFQRDRSRRAEDARAMVRRWAATAGNRKKDNGDSPGGFLALAYPDRVARSRGGGGGAFLLANGRGGIIDPASSLAREAYLVVAELAGAAAAGRIVLAAPITLEEIEQRFFDRIEDREFVTFDATSASLRARRVRRLGALILTEQTRPVAPDSESARLLAEGIAALGLHRLPWSKAQLQLRNRVMFLRRAEGEEWPDLSDGALSGTAAEWLHHSSRESLHCRKSAPMILPRYSQPCCRGICASGSTPRRRHIFLLRPARRCRLTTKRKQGRNFRYACRNCSALRCIQRS